MSELQPLDSATTVVCISTMVYKGMATYVGVYRSQHTKCVVFGLTLVQLFGKCMENQNWEPNPNQQMVPLCVIYTSFIHFPRNIPLEPTSGGFASKRRLSTLSRDKSRSTRCSSLCRWAQKCRRQAPKPFRSTGRGTLLEGGWTRKKGIFTRENQDFNKSTWDLYVIYEHSWLVSSVPGFMVEVSVLRYGCFNRLRAGAAHLPIYLPVISWGLILDTKWSNINFHMCHGQKMDCRTISGDCSEKSINSDLDS